ncbi:hypothetical protein EVAR_57260_1 [Eumeta japonica]|uniref:Uncharacterized protein n=1 Tax=Eumeta variegata TaxID=151549 RepID=A0A4C1ZVT5_EUMVA|nr:hypothetical protein EVAR_57260_1 [Eumeta japonica]
MYACYLYGLTLPLDRTIISRTRLSIVITIQILVKIMLCKRQSLTLSIRCDKSLYFDIRINLLLPNTATLYGESHCGGLLYNIVFLFNVKSTRGVEKSEKRHRVGGERRARGGGRAPISSRVSCASKEESPTHEQFVIYNSRRRRPETRQTRVGSSAPPRTAFAYFHKTASARRRRTSSGGEK